MNPDWTEIETRLKEALVKAKMEYETAKSEYDRLMIYATDLGPTHSDGASAFRSALRQRNTALLKYNEALITLSLYKFNRSIQDHEPPGEPK